MTVVATITEKPINRWDSKVVEVSKNLREEWSNGRPETGVTDFVRCLCSDYPRQTPEERIYIRRCVKAILRLWYRDCRDQELVYAIKQLLKEAKRLAAEYDVKNNPLPF